VTPISLAFNTNESSVPQLTFDITLNVSLLLDMIVNFRSAYYDANLNLIENQKVSEVTINDSVGNRKELFEGQVRNRFHHNTAHGIDIPEFQDLQTSPHGQSHQVLQICASYAVD
jgi:hypothetical protein